MKILLAFIFTSVLGVTSLNLDKISQALSQGDADQLEVYMDDLVELAIGENEDVLPKEEAIVTLKAFFAKNAPAQFNQVHKGASKGSASHYCIGDLKTSGPTYRVYIYLKNVDGQYLIQELRFDKT